MYKHVQYHIIILHQHVSVTVWTIIRVAYNKNKLIYNNRTQMYDKTNQC